MGQFPRELVKFDFVSQNWRKNGKKIFIFFLNRNWGQKIKKLKINLKIWPKTKKKKPKHFIFKLKSGQESAKNFKNWGIKIHFERQNRGKNGKKIGPKPDF